MGVDSIKVCFIYESLQELQVGSPSAPSFDLVGDGEQVEGLVLGGSSPSLPST